MKRLTRDFFCITFALLLQFFFSNILHAQCFVGIAGTLTVGSHLHACSNDSNINTLRWQLDGNTVYIARKMGFDIKGSTVAGNKKSGNADNELYAPDDVSVDAVGNIYVLDGFNNRVQKFAPGSTHAVTVAGGNGEGGAANQLFLPQGFFVDDAGNVYIADLYNHRVQKWSVGATAGITVAGGNGYGSAANQLAFPHDVFVDEDGNVFVTDGDNNRVQKWAPGATSGVTVAGGNGFGSGDNQLNSPFGLFVDDSENIYISDRVNFRIQKWAAGASSGVTVAGGALGSDSTELNNPKGIYVDASGAVYIADYFNNRIQKWIPGSNYGITVAGMLASGHGAYQFVNPSGVFVSASGNLFVADEGNNRVQRFLSSSKINKFYIPQQPGTYRVIASFESGCTDTSKEVVVGSQSATAITTNLSKSVANIEKPTTLFPNPAKQSATLQFYSHVQQKYTVKITDYSGKTVLQQTGIANSGNNMIKLNVNNLANGMYVVNLIKGINEKQNIKLIKE